MLLVVVVSEMCGWEADCVSESQAIIWKQLKHPNLLPFMGMYYLDQSRGQLCLISPWMEKGNLVRYLKDTPAEQVDYYSLVYDVASGISYLHSRKIVHGDLKGVNILVTSEERACIGDFGLSRVADTHGLSLTSTTAFSKGTTRWLAPELLHSDADSDLPCISSSFSDIYAFACICYEIFTGNVPFHGLKDGAVILAVVYEKRHPPRPNMSSLTDEMWNIMVECWMHDPLLRPAAAKVLGRITGLENLSVGPAPDWDHSDLSEIREDVNYPSFDTAALAQLRKKLISPTPIGTIG
ncbi:kinase-like protein [Marasmius fiardii PR-910]|nr:kinase-like protein [Marasmius fiardii PR-910]